MRHLIIAVHGEDLEWLSDLSERPEPWAIYPVRNGIHRDNVGREGGAYLWWITKCYSRIVDTDMYAFVQGNPFAHGVVLESFSARPDTWQPLGGYLFHSDADGTPDHPGLPVSEWYERFIGRPFPPGGLDIHAGAQFIMRGSTLKQHPREFYEAMLQRTEADPLAAWVLERLWSSIFKEA